MQVARSVRILSVATLQLFELFYNGCMFIRIDPAREAPLFEQIAASVRADIVAGELGPGDRLQSAREVAAGLGVNLHTVLHAYQLLRDEGLVELRRGRAATVTETARHLTALAEDIHRLAEKARTLGLSADALAALVKESLLKESL